MIPRLLKSCVLTPPCIEKYLRFTDYRAPRGLDKALIAQLATGQWIGEQLNLILLGPRRRTLV